MRASRFGLLTWCPCATAALAAALAALAPVCAECQITPAQASQLRNAIGDRVEALTILGGDYGIAGANFRSTGKFTFGESGDASIAVTKLGGSGDVGDPQPLGSLPVGWQPRVQGNMGWLDGTQTLHSSPVEGVSVEGDVTEIRTYGVEFGGGARFWVNDRLSLAPTVMGLYGHSSETYTANSAFMRANLDTARKLGLVDWDADTWTVITGVDVQYVMRWDRTIITLSSLPVYYHTETFESSNTHVNIHGDSGSWSNIVDVDVPLGMQLFGHELRSGGYYRWIGFYGDLRDGFQRSNLNEIHGRVVLDFLNQLWKVQWIGIGASYLWGPNITGWSAGLDVVFRF
jgi:hypothetical protein